MTDRIQKTLCSYGSKQFCEASAEVKTAVDPLAAVADAAADPLAAVVDAAADPLAAVVDAAADPLAAVVDAAADPLAAVADAAADPLAAVVDAAADPLAAVVDAANARFYFRAPKKGQATPTLSLAIRKLFSRLAVKVGFVACKLSVWCPDEAKAFRVPVEIAAPVEEPAAPVTAGARAQVVVGKFVG